MLQKLIEDGLEKCNVTLIIRITLFYAEGYNVRKMNDYYVVQYILMLYIKTSSVIKQLSSSEIFRNTYHNTIRQSELQLRKI